MSETKVSRTWQIDYNMIERRTLFVDATDMTEALQIFSDKMATFYEDPWRKLTIDVIKRLPERKADERETE